MLAAGLAKDWLLPCDRMREELKRNPCVAHESMSAREAAVKYFIKNHGVPMIQYY